MSKTESPRCQCRPSGKTKSSRKAVARANPQETKDMPEKNFLDIARTINEKCLMLEEKCRDLQECVDRLQKMSDVQDRRKEILFGALTDVADKFKVLSKCDDDAESLSKLWESPPDVSDFFNSNARLRDYVKDLIKVAKEVETVKEKVELLANVKTQIDDEKKAEKKHNTDYIGQHCD